MSATSGSMSERGDSSIGAAACDHPDMVEYDVLNMISMMGVKSNVKTSSIYNYAVGGSQIFTKHVLAFLTQGLVKGSVKNVCILKCASCVCVNCKEYENVKQDLFFGSVAIGEGTWKMKMHRFNRVQRCILDLYLNLESKFQ